VEPPGIAPGSSPLIARAFISIVRTSPDEADIGVSGRRLKCEASASAVGGWRSANGGVLFANGRRGFVTIVVGRRRPLRFPETLKDKEGAIS